MDKEEQINQKESTMKIHPQAFAAKFNSKREIWRFLSTDAGVYLPPYDVCTVPYMKDLLAGRCKLIRTKDVKHISVPFFEGLSIKLMLKWADTQPGEVLRAFPVV